MTTKKNVNHEGLRTWVEINTNAALRNYKQFRSLVSSTVKVMSVVKSNAYGHGLVPFALVMAEYGVDEIAVDSITEALALRKNGIKIPILVLGSTLSDRLVDAEEKSITLTVSNMECLDEVIKQFGLKIDMHIKVDTGMSRQGFTLDQLDLLMLTLKKIPKGVKVTGLYTHFAQAKNDKSTDFTKKQLIMFKKWREVFRLYNPTITVHAGATSGAIVYPEAHFDMVRIGIGMYGLWPSKEVRSFAEKKMELHPVLTWKSVISEVKKIPKGEGVGYDLTEVVLKDTKLAVCPVGYWHGYSRLLSSKGEVIIRGALAKVVGRISMGMLVVDITNIKGAVRGDEVVLLGVDGKNSITASDMADLTDTVNYEIVTCINPKIKRIFY